MKTNPHKYATEVGMMSNSCKIQMTVFNFSSQLLGGLWGRSGRGTLRLTKGTMVGGGNWSSWPFCKIAASCGRGVLWDCPSLTVITHCSYLLNLNVWTNHCQLEEDRQGYTKVTLQVQTHTHTHTHTQHVLHPHNDTSEAYLHWTLS